MLLWVLNLGFAGGGTPAAPATPGGGGGGKHHMELREEQRLQHPRPSFGFYADQLRRQQARADNGEPKPKLNWVRHYED